jgi:hypothetical protein
MINHTCICCTSESGYMSLDSSVGKVTDCGRTTAIRFPTGTVSSLRHRVKIHPSNQLVIGALSPNVNMTTHISLLH